MRMDKGRRITVLQRSVFDVWLSSLNCCWTANCTLFAGGVPCALMALCFSYISRSGHAVCTLMTCFLWTGLVWHALQTNLVICVDAWHETDTHGDYGHMPHNHCVFADMYWTSYKLDSQGMVFLTFASWHSALSDMDTWKLLDDAWNALTRIVD